MEIPSETRPPPTTLRPNLYGASGTALFFDPRRRSWQPLRPSVSSSMGGSDEPYKSREGRRWPSIRLTTPTRIKRSIELDSDVGLGADAKTADADAAANNNNQLPVRPKNDGWRPDTRNIAPKARILKNVLVLGCACMCTWGCFGPLSTYLSLTSDRKLPSPAPTLALSVLHACAGLSGFYGAAAARRLTYKLSIALCQLPYAVLLAALAYSDSYTLLPAAALVGLTQGPLFNAVLAYLINMAAQFAYFSFETQDKMAKRFLSSLTAFFACGCSWGHLLTAGAFNALENAHNLTDSPWELGANDGLCGSRYCAGGASVRPPTPMAPPPTITPTPTQSPANASGSMDHSVVSGVVPVYSMTVFGANVICGVLFSLFLLDKLKVQLCAQTNKPATGAQLCAQYTQIFCHQKMRLILPMFVFIGLEQAFLVSDVMKAYVSCTSPRSTVGYVMFAYGLVNTFLSVFLCAAVRHIRRITVLLGGLACQFGALIVMWMWKPISDDKPILYVISTSWSISDSIWTALCQTMIYQSFNEQWEAPFAAYYTGRAFGLAGGFLISVFGCMEYKIYFLAAATAFAILPFAIQELQAQKFDWFSSTSSPTASQ